MAKADVIGDLSSLRPEIFVSKYLFQSPPHAIPDPAAFTKWKSAFCNSLNVDENSAIMVGSGAVGISLNPYKNFKDFDGDSDIDMAVVSRRHFSLAWLYLRNNGSKRYKLLEAERIAWERHETGLVFWGAIEADKLLSIFPFGKDWVPALVRASTDVIGNREVKVRIYNDIDALRSYQIMGVTRLRSSLLDKGTM